MSCSLKVFMRNVSGKKTFLTVSVSQKEINRCSNRRMQEALQNACTGSRGSEESSGRAGLSCIWVTHRKIWGFAEVMDHIQMCKLIKAPNDKMSFHKVFGSSTGGDTESKFGNKLAAQSKSGWVLDEGSCLCLCEKSPRTGATYHEKGTYTLAFDPVCRKLPKETQWDWPHVLGQH